MAAMLRVAIFTMRKELRKWDPVPMVMGRRLAALRS